MNTSVPARTAAWQRHIRDCPELIHLAPPAVLPDSRLPDIVEALSSDPASRGVFVADAEDLLVGWIPERRLDVDLMLTALPGEIARSLGELGTRDLIRASHGKQQTARELMTPAKTVTPDGSLKDAILSMSRSGLQVIGLVDERKRLLGYLSLFEILAALLRSDG